VRRAGRLLAWAGLLAETSHAERLDASLRHFYRHRWRRFLLSVAFHLGGWMLGVLETMVFLWILNMPVGVGTAAVIEALGSGVRFATFLVPGSVGVLEGANAGVFAALGLGASAGLAFSLVFATFLVPGSVGVLEGANAGVFAALGLGASAGLAFSLVRRARQVVWIGLGLLVLVAARVQAMSANPAPRRATH